jgi:type IV secretory pathway VirB2 component (pilin)
MTMARATDWGGFVRSPAFWIMSALALLVLLGVASAHASDASAASAGSLPWDTPITTIRKDLSGPVAFGFALVGIFATGATLIWGGEISEFTRRMMYLVLVICVLVFSNTLLTGSLFSGALVPAGGLALDPTTAHARVQQGGAGAPSHAGAIAR